ncbi:hypothetical protein [Janthinobacterium sp. EB271-G4-7A]|uniref:hypothetical protein n=1 Tax=Janthinobacterium sp. EB271-G4-7A TaxID=2775056 RepID=UPI002E791596|nr:hypothetical protein [Janthinobacterium sp. EB271-G4-7A]
MRVASPVPDLPYLKVAVMTKQIQQHPQQHAARVTGLRNRLPRNGASGFRSADLLDVLIDFLGLKNDAALGRELHVSAPILSKIRHGSLPVSAAILIRMHEVSGLSIHELRACMGDHRANFGMLDEGERK